jgi:hypothetical protein
LVPHQQVSQGSDTITREHNKALSRLRSWAMQNKEARERDIAMISQAKLKRAAQRSYDLFMQTLNEYRNELLSLEPMSSTSINKKGFVSSRALNNLANELDKWQEQAREALNNWKAPGTKRRRINQQGG